MKQVCLRCKESLLTRFQRFRHKKKCEGPVAQVKKFKKGEVQIL